MNTGTFGGSTLDRWVWWGGLAAVLALAAVLIFAKLGDGGLRNGDEARYALVAHNILLTHDPVTLHYQGDPYFKKSPGRFWLSALTFWAFGINPWTVRLWSAVAGVAVVGLTSVMARNLNGTVAGLAAGLILATSSGFLHVHGARTGEMDTALIAFLLLALYPLTREYRPHDELIMGAALAACGLTKHLAFVPVGMVLVVLGSVATRRRALLRPKAAGAGLLLMGAILLPWFIVQTIINPHPFWQTYVGEVLGETMVAPPESDPGPGYYLGVVFSGAWPWIPLALAGIPALLMRSRRNWSRMLPVLWGGAFLLITMLTRRKLPWYAMAVYPFVAMTAGFPVSWLGKDGSTLRRSLLAALLTGTAGLAWLTGYHTMAFADRPAFKVVMDTRFLKDGLASWGWPVVALVLAAGMAAASLAVALNRGRETRQKAWLMAPVAALALFAVLDALQPLRHPYAGSWPAAFKAVRAAQVEPEQVVVTIPVPFSGRDDVRLYYQRLLSGSTQSTPVPLALERIGEADFEGAVVTSRRMGRRLAETLAYDHPGARVIRIYQDRHLTVLKVVNPSPEGSGQSQMRPR